MDDNLARCAVLSIVALLVIEWPTIIEPLGTAVIIGFVLTLLWVGVEYFWAGYRTESAA